MIQVDPRKPQKNEKRHNVDDAGGIKLAPGNLRTEATTKRRCNGDIEKTPLWPDSIRIVLPCHVRVGEGRHIV